MLALEFLNRAYNLIISTSKEAPLIISQLIPTFLGLVKKAACNIHDKMISAKEKLVKLDFTSSYEDVYNEFKRSYLDKVSEVYYLQR